MPPSRKRAPKDTGRKVKKKVCIFCKDKIQWVDYKDVNVLRRFMSDRGKIRARRVTGNCAQHQRDVAVAIKTAREVALLPYPQRTMSESRGPRGGGGGRGRPRDAEVPEIPDVDAVDVDAEAADVLVGAVGADVDTDGADADVEVAGEAGDDGLGDAEEELV